jgi:4-amino-4-deoxy-L-arabinose transferase-like glycosyltransferase
METERPRIARRTALALGVMLVAGLAVRAYVGWRWVDNPPDAYAYMGSAMELREHHTYALRPNPRCPRLPEAGKPTAARVPGYPLFLAVVSPGIHDFDSFYMVAKASQWLLDLVTGLLIFFLGLRIAGRTAALVATAAVMAHPLLVWLSNAVLSETLATTVDTAAIALLVAAADARLARPRAHRAAALAGVALGAAVLVRTDGLLLLPALALVPRLRRDTLRSWLRPLLTSLGLFALTLAPWAVRNQVQLGKPHLLAGGMCDTCGRDVNITWHVRWAATWLEKEDDLAALWSINDRAAIWRLPPSATDSPAERAEVDRVTALRSKGKDAEADAGFRALALDRMKRHPVASFLTLPLVRAWHMLLPDAGPRWLHAYVHLRAYAGVATALLAVAGLAVALLVGAWRARRRLLVFLAMIIGLRIAVLAFAGYCESRYAVEVVPSLLLLVGVAVAEVVRRVGRAQEAP